MAKLLKLHQFFFLMLLISLPQTAAVFLTPAFPELVRFFHLNEAQGQWLMSIFLLGFTMGPLIYGPLSNRFGRKKSLFMGLGLFIVGSIFTIFADKFWVICLGRFVQALGAAAGLKITFTMVGDLFEGKSATKALSYLLYGAAIAPSIGAAIGGFLTDSFGWKACFIFLAFYGFFLLLLTMTLPETAKQLDPEALSMRRIAHDYSRQFKDSFIILHAFLMGTAAALLYVFANEAPYIGINTMGLSPDQYGLYNLVLPVGTALGLVIGGHLAGKAPPRLAMIIGVLITFIGVLFMAVCFLKNWMMGWSLFLPQAMIQMGGLLYFLFASTKGLSESRDKANASAVMQFINLGTATAATLVIGAFASKTPLTLTLSLGMLTAIAFIIWSCLREHHKKSPH